MGEINYYTKEFCENCGIGRHLKIFSPKNINQRGSFRYFYNLKEEQAEMHQYSGPNCNGNSINTRKFILNKCYPTDMGFFFKVIK